MKQLIILISLFSLLSCSKSNEQQKEVLTYSNLEYQENDTVIYNTYCANCYIIEIDYESNVIIYTLTDNKTMQPYCKREPFEGNTTTTFEHTAETFKIVGTNFYYTYSK